jgi:alkylation response protein AidB-like acyl-CoA dehydrogenase
MFSEKEAEHDVFRDSIRRLMRDFGHDYFLRTSNEKSNARELWNALGNAGWLGIFIPEEFGGGGAGIEELAIVSEETAIAGSPLMLISLSPAVCASMLVHHGSDAQKSAWLPGLANGSKVLGFAITEPNAGSNTHNITTRARFEDGQWVISGQKYYVSHVDNCDALMVVAHGEGGPDHLAAGLKVFLVPTDAHGLSRTEISVEVTSPELQYSLFFDEVRVPADTIVGAQDGLSILFTGLNPERISSAALLNGIARYAIDKAVAYAQTRTVWQSPIGAHQAISHPLARAETMLTASRLLTKKAACDFDSGISAGVSSAMAKLAASDAASFALDVAIQTHGGNGMAREYGLSTLSGLVRLFRIAPVSSEMLLNHIAHKALALPRSY